MTDYPLTEAHTLLRDVRLSAKLTQRELADNLLCKTPLVSMRETRRLNLSLGIIAGHVTRCGRVLQLRIGDGLFDPGLALSKVSIFTVDEIAAEFGVTVRLVATKRK